jgi:multidrug efflux system outer membrane protein
LISRRAAALGSVALLLAGCALGKNYRRPDELPAQPAFRGETSPVARSFVDELPWWQIFGDPVLVGLIEEALANSRDLAAAAARVEQSRFLVGVARADLFPQIGYRAEGGRLRTSENVVGTGDTGGDTTDLFLGALDLAWELDIWGRIRRSTEAARAELLATEAFERGVRLSLVSGVAQAYFELRELDLELEIAHHSADSFEATYDLFQRQFEGGVASRLAVERAAAALAETLATVPELEARIVAKENELSVLVGRTPGEISRGGTLAEQSEPPEVPAGLPSDLLERRPDLIEREETLVAANARVGQSIADFFPRIGLTSVYGHQSSELSSLLESGSLAWSAAALVTGPIFEGGRRWYLFQGSKAERAAAQEDYEQSVLVALREVSDALVARDRLALARGHQARAVAAYEESVRLAQVRFWGGLANYFEVLDAQQLLFPSEIRLARLDLDRLTAFVQLYRALGGGWSLDHTPATAPAPAPAPTP